MKQLKQYFGVAAALLLPTLLPWMIVLLNQSIAMSDGIYQAVLFLAMPFLLLIFFIAARPCSIYWLAAGFGLSLVLLGLVGGGFRQYGLGVMLTTFSPYALPWCMVSLVVARKNPRKKTNP